MSGLIERIVVQSEGATLSKIIWRRFRRPMPGLVERVLDENAGLADLGEELPVGTVFLLPVDKPASTAPAKPVRLW